MLTEIENTPEGYIVSVHIPDNRGYYHWERLRNFGDRQGDAIEFRDIDVPTLSPEHIWALVRRFNITTKYMRVSHTRFDRQRN